MAIFHQELGQVCTTMYLQGSAADNTGVQDARQ